MLTAIQVVWWIGLVGALVLTAFILKRVFRLLHVLRDILSLAEYTQTAASGLAHYAKAVERLRALSTPVNELPQSARRLAEVTAEIARQVGAPVAESGSRGG